MNAPRRILEMRDDPTSVGLSPSSNPVFGIEVRGFERIPEAERNMTLPQVGPLWLATNMNVLSIVLGCMGITLGLNLWWAFAACIVGNLPYAYVGLASIGTVRTGLPVTTLTRAVFGLRGNFPNAFFGWIASLAYEVVGTVLGVYALIALMKVLGWHGSDTTGKLLATLILLLLSGGVAVLGHATMVFLQRFFAVILGAALFLVLIHTCGQVDWSRAAMPHAPLTSTRVAAAFMTACGLLASQPIGYLFNGPDWVRYLPIATPGRQVFSRVFLWTFLPSIVLTAMGAMWATLGDMADPVAGLRPFIPRWLFVIYALAVAGGAVAANIPVFYSSGLSLQSLGLRVSRWAATAVDLLVSTAIVVYILFVQDFTTALNDFVSLLLVWVGPYGAVWMCDGVLTHWGNPTVAGRDRSVNGVIALIGGMVVGLMTMKSPLYDGPIAIALGGMDLNWVLGFPVSGAIYYMLSAAPLRRARVAARL